jgi:hypothetical protein
MCGRRKRFKKRLGFSHAQLLVIATSMGLSLLASAVTGNANGNVRTEEAV